MKRRFLGKFMGVAMVLLAFGVGSVYADMMTCPDGSVVAVGGTCLTNITSDATTCPGGFSPDASGYCPPEAYGTAGTVDAPCPGGMFPDSLGYCPPDPSGTVNGLITCADGSMVAAGDPCPYDSQFHPNPTYEGYDELTADQFGALDPTVFGVVTADMMGYFDPAAMNGFTAAQMGYMDPAAMAGFDAAQVGNMDPAAMAGFNAAQVGYMDPAAIAGFDAAQVGNMDPAAMAGFNAAQVGYMDPAAMVGFDAAQVGYMNPAAMAGFTAAQVGYMNPAAMAGLTAAQIIFMDPAAMAGFDAAHMDYLTPEAIASFGADHMRHFDPVTIAGLTPAMIQNFDPAAMAGFRPEYFEGMNAMDMTAFSTDQFGNIPHDAMSGISPESFGQLPADLLGALTAENLGGLAPATINEIIPSQLQSFDPAAFQAMPSRDFAKIMANFDPALIDPNDVHGLIPPEWALDPLTGELTPPEGAGIAFPPVTTSFDPGVVFPEVPDLSLGVGLGGAGDDTLSQLDGALVAAGVVGFSFSQNNGILVATGTGNSAGGTFAFIPDTGAMVQGPANAVPGVSTNEAGQYVMTTANGMQIPVIPAPVDPDGLVNLLPNGSVNVGGDGEVLMALDETHQISGIFDPYVVGDDGALLSAGVHLHGTPGLDEWAVVVYADGMSQAVSPAMISTQEFADTASQFPGVSGVVMNMDGSFDLMSNGQSYHLVPGFSVSQPTDATGAYIDPVIGLDNNGNLQYTDSTGATQNFYITTE